MQRGNDEDVANRSKGLPLSSSSRKKNEKGRRDSPLPWDVLDIIYKKLDFDDLFQVARVCKSWNSFHKIYWRNFMASQAPLLVQTSSYAKKSLSFISIADQNVYRSKMDYYWGFSYSGSSSGYLIMADVGILLLMNPFTRRKKEINTSALQGNMDFTDCHALLAFAKGSEEFIIVVSCKRSYNLHVYRSRTSCWVTYSRSGNPWKVVDFVVLHNIIYVITNQGKIGVLSLNSPCLKFIELKNAPSVISKNLKLVNCDGQLLMVHFEPKEILDVYKIDFSTMEYVKLETLGDIALFYAKHTNCYALSNPSRWGYESNSVYYINCASAQCMVYSGDKNEMIIQIVPWGLRAPPRSRLYWLDWCFQCLHDEVDYSLVD